MPRKFAKAANAQLVDSSDKERFQFLLENIQWNVRWLQINW